jgi:unsaturated rhamnogalacturonyl hydrolase
MRNGTLVGASWIALGLAYGLIVSGCDSGSGPGVTPGMDAMQETTPPGTDTGQNPQPEVTPEQDTGPGPVVEPKVDSGTPDNGPTPEVAPDTGVTPPPDAGPPGALSATVIAQMRKVADWQVPRAGVAKDWIHGAMWTGIFATYQVTKDQKYLDAIKSWAGAGWALSGGAGARGDNQCAAQTFFDTYLLDPTPANIAMINGAKPSFDSLVGENRAGRDEWWWEDALFMVPPGMVRLAVATKDNKYIDKMNTLYWDSYQFLWSNQAGLMVRDHRGQDGNFWARGNGWVIAGVARILTYLPQDNPKRAAFVTMLKTMANSLKAVQQPDGLWRANLLQPNSVPNPETSGTGFFTFAMAWGINNGILDKATYLPVVTKGWEGLNSHVDAAGKLGYVQPVGAGPAPAGAGSTVEYGVGAFLLAGSEMAKLLP